LKIIDIQALKEERAKIKQAIMDLGQIKSGFNLDKYQLIQALKKEKNFAPSEEELMTALAELIREGRLPGSSVVSLYLDGGRYKTGSWQIVVHSFGTDKT